MSNGTLLAIFASAGFAIAAPVEELSYQWLAPDGTTVLCSSKIPGSCDAFADDADGEEMFLGSHTNLEVTPYSLNAFTQVSTWFIIVPGVQNLFRGKYIFEAEWDLGWFAFTGGTGDFLATYFWGMQR